MENKEKVVFENQNNFRVLNQIRVMDSLKKGPKSCVVLSEELSLSFTAIAKIVNELCESGLTIMLPGHPDPEKKAGRRPAFVALNNKLGVFAAIDFSNRDIGIALSSLDDTILIEESLEEDDLISEETLAKVARKIETLLTAKNVAGMPLLGVCISTPGLLDSEGNYIFAHRIADYQHLNMKRYFSAHFHVDVSVYHDVKLGCVGERVFGAIPKEAQNVYFAFIDNDAGSSFFLNGHLYSGAHGLAGEVNDLKGIDEESKSSRNGQFFTLEDIRDEVKKSLAKVAKHPLKGQKHYHVKDLAALYLSGDEIVSAAVDKSARYNAIQLLSIANLLDVEYLVIQGRILEFGESYRNLLIHYFSAYDMNRSTAKIVFSSLGSRANLLGAVYQGANIYRLKRFGEMTAKRTLSEDYDVREYFGDNI
jgi:predicted NBD/HSP70 family sugar kinase